MADDNQQQTDRYYYNNWRHAMGWLYMATCAFDFIIAPILWPLFQAIIGINMGGILPWDPLTLKGAGFYHMAMGAVLGISAWGRNQEKLEIIKNNNMLNNFEKPGNTEGK